MRFLLVLFSSLAAAEPLPREIVPGKAVLEAQPDEGNRKVWHTRYFRIDSDQAFTPNALLRLSQVADTTAMAVKAHPLPLFAPPEGARSRIAVHADPSEYLAAGGFPGSSGFYLNRQALILLRGDYLAKAPDAAASRLGPKQDEDLLVHELVHLCMHRENFGLPQWLTEGLSEYFACAHTGAGRFDFGDMDKAVREHLRIRLSPDDPGIPLVPVSDLAGLRDRGWLHYLSRLPVNDRYQAYATSLLLAHYHLNGGDARLALVREVLAKPPRERRNVSLLPPEIAAATQDALVRYWKPRGLTLEFSGDDPSTKSKRKD